MHRVTLKDVAKSAGVHPATVSRALNDETRNLVNPRTAARVRAAATRLGYTANPIARSLKTARSTTIGVVIPDLTNPLFPPIARGIEDVLHAKGYNAWMINTDNSPEREAEAVDSFRQRSVEGFVFATARLEHPLLEDLARASTPLVLVNRSVIGSPIPSVTADDATGVMLAMQHLYELGHREIVHLAGPQDLSTGLNRRTAFEQSLRRLGLPSEPERVHYCGSWSAADGAIGLTSLLDSGIPFTAVLGGNDLLALGAVDAVTARGLRCPDDLSVIGFNDIPFMDRVTPPMTTVRIPHYESGAEAARLLLEAIADPTRYPRSLLLPPSLMIRGSSSPPHR